MVVRDDDDDDAVAFSKQTESYIICIRKVIITQVESHIVCIRVVIVTLITTSCDNSGKYYEFLKNALQVQILPHFETHITVFPKLNLKIDFVVVFYHLGAPFCLHARVWPGDLGG